MFYVEAIVKLCTDRVSVHFEMEQNHLCPCFCTHFVWTVVVVVLYCPLLLPCSANDLMAVPSCLGCMVCKCHPNGGTVFSLPVSGETEAKRAPNDHQHISNKCTLCQLAGIEVGRQRKGINVSLSRCFSLRVKRVLISTNWLHFLMTAKKC